MPDMFDLTWDKPKPLVPRRHRLEVAERMAADGSVVEPLNEASVIAAGEQLVAAGIEAVAICLINSYRNPAHEQRVEAILRERFPQLLVTASYAVLPERKEYERTSTTVVNAYLLVAMRSYLQQPRRPACAPSASRRRSASSPPTAACWRRRRPARSRCSWWPPARPAA